jgi:hypothetical protein
MLIIRGLTVDHEVSLLLEVEGGEGALVKPEDKGPVPSTGIAFSLKCAIRQSQT